MPDIDQALAARLRDARARSHLSQEDLAVRIGVTSATVSRIENGLRSPSTRTLYRWSRVCGFDLELVEVGDESTTAEIVALIDEMDAADLELTLRVMRALPTMADPIKRALTGLIATHEP